METSCLLRPRSYVSSTGQIIRRSFTVNLIPRILKISIKRGLDLYSRLAGQSASQPKCGRSHISEILFESRTPCCFFIEMWRYILKHRASIGFIEHSSQLSSHRTCLKLLIVDGKCWKMFIGLNCFIMIFFKKLKKSVV